MKSKLSAILKKSGAKVDKKLKASTIEASSATRFTEDGVWLVSGIVSEDKAAPEVPEDKCA